MGGLTYQEEENRLLYSLLDKRFFSVWKNPEKTLWKMSSLELFITPDCNLACEYCYLRICRKISFTFVAVYRGFRGYAAANLVKVIFRHILNKHKRALYPSEFAGEDRIISNLHKLFKWMKAERFSLNELQLFSGEIWHLPFGFKVLDIILSYIDQGLRIGSITLPTNSSFLRNKDTSAPMQSLIDKFAKAGCRFIISHSIDGKVLEDISRPFKGANPLNRDDTFYEDIFTFAKKNTFYFHPMVAAANIEYWPENYDWFKDRICEIIT